MPERDMYKVVVKRTYLGSAVVLINDKWRARVIPEIEVELTRVLYKFVYDKRYQAKKEHDTDDSATFK